MGSLVGAWKLISARAFDEAGRELPSPLGPQPMGVAIFDSERGMAMAADGRPDLPPKQSGHSPLTAVGIPSTEQWL
jgi:hypothetical protein